jgi:hypothetical protein
MNGLNGLDAVQAQPGIQPVTHHTMRWKEQIDNYAFELAEPGQAWRSALR